jgi:cytochrome oxidase Cu insertion factor (SCO1/SenC/PrrC family)
MEVGAGIRSGPRPRRVRLAQIAVALIAALLVGIGAGIALHSLLAKPAPATTATRPASLHGEATWAAGARPAPAITTLHDQTGHLFSLASLRGRTVAMTFFDSHCNQQCPLEGRALADAERALPPAQRPVLVAVSVNTLDTPESERAAARSWGLAQGAPWHWLTGSRGQLAQVWRAYHIYVGRPVNGDIPHTEALYLIDRAGDERSGYLYPFLPRFVTLDLRTLARGVRG